MMRCLHSLPVLIFSYFLETLKRGIFARPYRDQLTQGFHMETYHFKLAVSPSLHLVAPVSIQVSNILIYITPLVSVSKLLVVISITFVSGSASAGLINLLCTYHLCMLAIHACAVDILIVSGTNKVIYR